MSQRLRPLLLQPRPPRWDLFSAVLLALVLLATVVLRWYRLTEYNFAIGHPDTAQYTDAVLALLEGKPFTPSIIRVNGTYAWFLYSVLNFFGLSSYTVAVAQTILSVVAALCTLGVVSRLTGSYSVAATAVLFLLLLPRGFLYEQILLGDTVYAANILLLVAAAYWFWARGTVLAASTLGFLTAALLLGRGQGLGALVVVLALFALMVLFRRVSGKRSLLCLVAYLVPVAVLCQLYLLANQRQNNFSGLSAAGNYNLFWIATSRYLDFESPLHAGIKRQLRRQARWTNKTLGMNLHWGIEGLSSAGDLLAGVDFDTDDWSKIDQVNKELAREAFYAHPLAIIHRVLWNFGDMIWWRGGLFETVDLKDLMFSGGEHSKLRIDPKKLEYCKKLDALAPGLTKLSGLPPVPAVDLSAVAGLSEPNNLLTTERWLRLLAPLSDFRVLVIAGFFAAALAFARSGDTAVFAGFVMALALSQIVLTVIAANGLYDRYYIAAEPLFVILCALGLSSAAAIGVRQSIKTCVTAASLAYMLYHIYYLGVSLPISYPVIDKGIPGLSIEHTIQQQRAVVGVLCSVLLAPSLLLASIICWQREWFGPAQLLLSRIAAYFDRRSDLSKAAIFAFGVSCIVLWRVVAFDEVPILSPVGNITDPAPTNLVFGPGSELVRKIVTRGLSFLWSSARDMGTPVLFQEFQAAPLHPWSIIRSLLPYSLRWQLNGFLLLTVLGVAHLVLARRVFLFGWPASVLFTLAAAFNPFVLKNLNHHYLLTYVSSVWALYFVLRSLSNSAVEQDRNSTWQPWLFLGLVLSVALSIVGGFPEAVFPVACICGCVYFVTYFTLPRRQWLSSLGLSVVASVVALALTSHQVFAFLDGLSVMGEEFRGGLGLVSIDPQLYTNIFFRVDQFSNRVFFWSGLTVLFFLLPAPFLAFRERSSNKFSANGAIGVGLLLATVLFLLQLFALVPWLHQFIGELPIITVSNIYGYFPPMFLFGVAWLVGGAAEFLCRLQNDQQRRRLIRGASVAWLVCVVYVVAGTLELTRYSFNVNHWWRLLPPICGVALCRAWSVRQRLSAAAVIYALCVLLLVEQAVLMKGFEYYSSKEIERIQFGHGYKRVAKLVCGRGDRADSRLYWGDKILPEFCLANPDSTATATPVPRMNSLKWILFRRSIVLHEPQLPYSMALTGIRWLVGDGGLEQQLDKLGVAFTRRLALPKRATLLEVKDVLPRAYLTNSCRVLGDQGTVAREIEQGRYRVGEALLEDVPSDVKDYCLQSAPPSIGDVHRVAITSDTGSTVKLATVKGPGVLVLSDSYFPGWSAEIVSVDSTSTAMPVAHYPANLAYRGIYLPEAKQYQIVYRYRPYWLPWANLCLGLSIVGLLSILVVLVRKKTA